MREILFRGKQKNNGLWVHGDLSYHRDGRVFIRCWERLEFDPAYSAYEVDPETVGQFTGLTDKNGKMIFEGDILEFRRGRTHIVNFEDGAFVFTGTAIPVRYADKFEVIGNIHDNPELLEGRK